ncbi:hypothetical protein ABTJ67_20780, partial [Acinetobacter baumannii]
MWAALATLVMGVLLAPYGPVPVAWATAGILLGISIAYMAKGARLTGLSGASLASILAPALLPAAGVFLAVSFSDNLAQAWRL